MCVYSVCVYIVCVYICYVQCACVVCVLCVCCVCVCAIPAGSRKPEPGESRVWGWFLCPIFTLLVSFSVLPFCPNFPDFIIQLISDSWRMSVIFIYFHYYSSRLYFCMNFLFVFFFSIHLDSFDHLSCRILVPWPGDRTRASAVETQDPNQWTTRNFLKMSFRNNFLVF